MVNDESGKIGMERGGDSATEERKWNGQLNRLTMDKNEQYGKENDRAYVHQRKNIEGNIMDENQTIRIGK